MIKFIKENKVKIFLIIVLILWSALFFNYNIITTYDSSEYLGMADVLGKSEMKSIWIGHRGLSFPLLIKIFLLLGINGKYPLLIMLYVFYLIMIFGLVKIYKNLKDKGFFNDKYSKVIYCILVFLLIILNPIIFGYYHAVLTEFISMTISVITSYLCLKWLDIDIKENKKESIIYAVIFALLSVFLYHVKQSLIPIMLVSLLITSLMSIIERCTLKNFALRFFTIMFSAVMAILSVIIWNVLMSDIHVAEKTENLRIKNKLIIGITEIKEVCDSENSEDLNINDFNISNKDKEEINNIMNERSNYKAFKIYKNIKNKYFVFYTKDNYSFSEQLGFYIKILFSSPQDVIDSYSKSYYKLIFRDEHVPISRFIENYLIPMRIFSTKSNMIDVNSEYEKYIEPYKIDEITHNSVAKIFNDIEFKLMDGFTAFTKCNVYILLFLIVILFGIYLVYRKKMNMTNKKVMQFIIILYTISYGTIMPYVIFKHLVDRYIIPTLILTYLADILLVILIVKNVINKIRKSINKKTKNSKKYLLN